MYKEGKSFMQIRGPKLSIMHSHRPLNVDESIFHDFGIKTSPYIVLSSGHCSVYGYLYILINITMIKTMVLS